MGLEDRIKKQEEKKSLLALIILAVVLLTFIWNLLILPTIVEKSMTSNNDVYTCNSFCKGVNGASKYELEYHQDEGLAYCYCKDNEGRVLARPTYNLV